jgi:glycosyltransferase involved in cell wall biosynthesis
MARKRIVISSKTDGGKELIKDNKNGFLFNLKNIKELKKILFEINKLSDTKIKNMTNNAYKESEKYSLSKNIDKLEELF